MSGTHPRRKARNSTYTVVLEFLMDEPRGQQEALLKASRDESPHSSSSFLWTQDPTMAPVAGAGSYAAEKRKQLGGKSGIVRSPSFDNGPGG